MRVGSRPAPLERREVSGVSVDLPLPSLSRPDLGAAGIPTVDLVVERGRRWHVSVVNAGLACCAVEFVSALVRWRDAGLVAASETAEPAGGANPVLAAGAETDGRVPAYLLVVSGTVTDKILPAVVRAWEQLPQPRHVMSFGACSNSGGPYWDSYCVTKGIDQVLPVDVYVPGCPPRPEAVLDGIAQLEGTLDADA